MIEGEKLTVRVRRICLFAMRYANAVAAHLFLVGMGWMTRYRAPLYEASYQLGWRKRPIRDDGMPTLHIPEVTIAELFANPPAVRILEPDVADGNVSALEMLVITQLIAGREATRCFEIGTFDGRTTLNMAVNTGPESRVYTLDLPATDLGKTALAIAPGDQSFIQKQASGGRFVGTVWEQKITQLYGDSATFEFSPYEGKMDVVFVDGAHSYDYVKTDTATALRLIKPDGIILWHDYGSKWWKDLTRAMNELYADEAQLKQMRHVQGTTLVVMDAGESRAL